jgi:putative transposase
MNTYKRHRFPPDIISYAVWLYYRFNLSHRDIEDLLAERGIIVTRESIRLWCIKFGAIYTRRLKRKHRGYGDTFYIDEVFIKINGKQHYGTDKLTYFCSKSGNSKRVNQNNKARSGT